MSAAPGRILHASGCYHMIIILSTYSTSVKCQKNKQTKPRLVSVQIQSPKMGSLTIFWKLKSRFPGLGQNRGRNNMTTLSTKWKNIWSSAFFCTSFSPLVLNPNGLWQCVNRMLQQCHGLQGCFCALPGNVSVHLPRICRTYDMRVTVNTLADRQEV